MPRNGAGVYSLPAGSLATPGSPIVAATHNTPVNDLAADANTARPIVAGGTGASSASGARAALGVALAQTDPDDATPNSGMIVGAFGLGSAARLSGDWTAFPDFVSALYRTSTSSVPGAPDLSPNWGTVHVSCSLANSRAFDIAVKADTPAGLPDMRVRVNDGSTLGPWFKMQAAGAPIDGSAIGGVTPASGAFTTLSTTGAAVFGTTVAVNSTLTVGGGLVGPTFITSAGSITGTTLVATSNQVRGNGTNKPMILAPNTGSTEVGIGVSIRPQGASAPSTATTFDASGSVAIPGALSVGASLSATFTTFSSTMTCSTAISTDNVFRGQGTNNPVILAPNSGMGETGTTVSIRPQGSNAPGTATTWNANGNATFPGQVAASVFNGSGASITGLPIDGGTSGTLPIARGGTAATTAAGARSSLGADDAGNLTSGTLASARLPTDAAAANWVGARVVALGLGGLGWPIFAYDSVDRASNYGDTRSGADLRPSQAAGTASGGTFAGTWTCLGRCFAGAGIAARATSWIRTS